MKKSRISIIAIILLFISFVCVCVGISISIFTYFGQGNTTNVIETGRVVFSYSDAEGGSNGIYIQDALPIPDADGKVLSGNREYFDFSVMSTSTSTSLNYEVVVQKDNTSTLDDKYVKIYLTTFEGTSEMATPLTTTGTEVMTYNALANTTNPLLTGKTIYYGTVNAGEVGYSKKFRLRMWVADSSDLDYDQINNKSYSVKVNVAASGAH